MEVLPRYNRRHVLCGYTHLAVTGMRPSCGRAAINDGRRSWLKGRAAASLSIWRARRVGVRDDGSQPIECFLQFHRQAPATGVEFPAPLISACPSRLPGLRQLGGPAQGEGLDERVCLQDVFRRLGLFHPFDRDNQLVHGISLGTRHGDGDAAAVEKNRAFSLVKEEIEMPQRLGTGAAQGFHPGGPALMVGGASIGGQKIDGVVYLISITRRHVGILEVGDRPEGRIDAPGDSPAGRQCSRRCSPICPRTGRNPRPASSRGGSGDLPRAARRKSGTPACQRALPAAGRSPPSTSLRRWHPTRDRAWEGPRRSGRE